MKSLMWRLEDLENSLGRLSSGKLLGLFLAAVGGDHSAAKKLLAAPMTDRTDRLDEFYCALRDAEPGTEADDVSE
jgi:hypothetical protein